MTLHQVRGAEGRLSSPAPDDLASPSLARPARDHPTWMAGRRSRIRLGPAQDFVGHRGDITLAEEDELGQVLERIAFHPAKVDVRLEPVTSWIWSSTAAIVFGTDGPSTLSTA